MFTYVLRRPASFSGLAVRNTWLAGQPHRVSSFCLSAPLDILSCDQVIEAILFASSYNHSKLSNLIQNAVYSTCLLELPLSFSCFLSPFCKIRYLCEVVEQFLYSRSFLWGAHKSSDLSYVLYLKSSLPVSIDIHFPFSFLYRLFFFFGKSSFRIFFLSSFSGTFVSLFSFSTRHSILQESFWLDNRAVVFYTCFVGDHSCIFSFLGPV